MRPAAHGCPAEVFAVRGERAVSRGPIGVAASRGHGAGERGRRCAAARRTLALLERGRERYRIYCLPCHGEYGDGDGRVVAKFGFPQPPSLHDERLLAATDAHLLDVVIRGYGVMYSYSTVLPPRDRWAVVGYLRALQLARHADVAQFPGLRTDVNEAQQ